MWSCVRLGKGCQAEGLVVGLLRSTVARLSSSTWEMGPAMMHRDSGEVGFGEFFGDSERAAAHAAQCGHLITNGVLDTAISRNRRSIPAICMRAGAFLGKYTMRSTMVIPPANTANSCIRQRKTHAHVSMWAWGGWLGKKGPLSSHTRADVPW